MVVPSTYFENVSMNQYSSMQKNNSIENQLLFLIDLTILDNRIHKDHNLPYSILINTIT